MSRILIPGLVLLVFTLPAFSQTPQAVPQSTADAASPEPTPFETAEALAAKGRLSKAMALLDQLAAQSPEPAGVERLRGIIFYQREDFAKAIDAFTRASQQDPADRE